jgi:hypothetical protein
MYLFYWKWSVIWAIDFLTAREPVWNLKRCWRVCWRASRGGVFPLETLCGSVVHFKECKWSIVIPCYSQIFAFALPSMNEAVLGKRTAKVGQRVWLGQKVWKPKFPKWVLVCKDFFPPGWCVCVLFHTTLTAEEAPLGSLDCVIRCHTLCSSEKLHHPCPTNMFSILNGAMKIDRTMWCWLRDNTGCWPLSFVARESRWLTLNPCSIFWERPTGAVFSWWLLQLSLKWFDMTL